LKTAYVDQFTAYMIRTDVVCYMTLTANDNKLTNSAAPAP
jgi:hypothetical protein